MARGKINNFFPGGNTAVGFYSFYQYLPYKCNQIYIVKGGPGTGKSTFMKKIAYEMLEKGYNIELHWCSSDNNSLDGLVIPKLKTAFLDGTAPHMIDPENPGAIDEIINLGAFWDRNYLKKHQAEIIKLNKLIKKRFRQVYDYLAIAKKIHDQWESYYIDSLNFNKANQKAENLIEQIGPISQRSSTAEERHLFASAITPGGIISHLASLTENIQNRFIIKGEPGTGKSTLIAKVGHYLKQRTQHLLYLHSPLDPQKIDALIIPELNTAVLNGTAPHNLEAKQDGDQLLDMLSCVNLTSIRQYVDEINEVKKLYAEVMGKVQKYLKLAKLSHDEMEEFYITAMDFAAVEAKRKEIIKTLP